MPEITFMTIGFENRPTAKTMSTPWGTADHVEKIAEGVIEVGTPSHGGIGIEKPLAEQRLSTEARAKAIQQGGWFWFEEDCDWAIPVAEMPDLFTEPRHGPERVAEVLERWHPEYLAARKEA